ncbi:MAG: UDP-N-acetylmuramoyl-tripeptide--D-alanyl-D-alanine ligase [Candidatus Fermentibacteraceae bacterium]|nr:UDP-N-acetylmuramoyl-tripeptide--D-alanyl-D-alanine ligase [Candidatus Fermentibacteraceae bacterium]
MILASDIARATGGWVSPDTSSRSIKNVVIDSRLSEKDTLFFALEGKRTDGHLYVSEVVEKGGIAVVARDQKQNGIILVHSVEQALLDAAKWRRQQFESKVIAITGSSGKTTTRKLLSAALRTSCDVYCTSGNLNNQLGLPMTILNVPDPPPSIIILEMGMNHAGELTLLGSIALPTDCLITNIGLAHLEYFPSRECIAKAKAEVIQTTESGGTCVIPVGEPILRKAALDRNLSIRYFGDKGNAWFEKDGDSYRLYPWEIKLNLQFEGDHNVSNAISALLMAENFDVSPQTAARAMENVAPDAGRGRIVEAGDVTILDESYNANPDSTRACLNVLRDIKGDRAAVLGDMRELGDSAQELHRQMLKTADSLGLKFLILTGDLYNSVKSTVVHTDVLSAEDWLEALTLLRQTVTPGCTVLVKGSNSVRLSELVRHMEEDS